MGMRYLIREKVFSLGDNFTIKTFEGYDAFKVVGKVFSLGNKLRIYSMDDRELVYIEQKVFKFLPEYNIYLDNSLAAVLKKEFTFLKPKLNIESRFGNFYIEGNIFARSFQVFKDGYIVADIYKKALSFSDTYEVEVDDSQNHAFILALVIAIDQIFHDNKNR